jgi:uncharacterized RDD family membrane protein YckC
MIIFGWGRRKHKKFGPTRAHHCNNCKNDTYWDLVEVSTWFTLAFIPIFPYEIKRLLVCPICGCCIELSSEEFKQLKNMNVSSSEEINNYGKTETQINFIKQMNEIKEEKNEIKTESNSSVAVLNDTNTQNNNAIETNNDIDKVSILTIVLARLVDIVLPIGISLVGLTDSEILKTLAGLSIMAISLTQMVMLGISGQTIGKKIFKIKIVKVDTNTNGGFIRNFILRHFLSTILYGTVIYGIADIACIARKDGRCVHDFIAGTKVVKGKNLGQSTYNNLPALQTETNSNKNKIIKVALMIFGGFAAFSIFLIFTTLVICGFARSAENTKEKAAYNYIESLSENSMANKPLKTLRVDSKKYGKLAPLINIVNEDINKTNSIHNKFIEGFEEKTSEDKFPRGLTSKELFKDIDTIKQTRANLKELDDFLTKCEADIKSNKANTDKKLAKLKRLDTKTEEESIDKYDSLREERYHKSIQDINNEKSYVKKLDQCFEFMESRQGQYEVSDKEIIFYNQSDVDTWNKLILDVKKPTKNQKESMLL